MSVLVGLLLHCMLPTTLIVQQNSLRTALEHIVQPANATVGVSVMHFGNQDTLTINGGQHYPMQSTFKFPLAMAVLHQVDQGKLSLDQQVHLSKEDMLQNTWSPLTQKYPEGNVDLPLRDILRYTVAESDNSGCDILFKMLGGPQAAQQYMRSIGVKDMAIVATEQQMHQGWEVQFTNRTQPAAMTRLLQIAFRTRTLTKESQTFLWNIMEHSVPGAQRIKGKLPEGTVVAHKTGTGYPNEKGLLSACNDVGIISLPDGQQVALAVFVTQSLEDFNSNQVIIADIARAVYDHYVAQGK